MAELSVTTIEKLPSELLLNIFARGEIKDIRSCVCVCKGWKGVIKHGETQKKLIEMHLKLGRRMTTLICDLSYSGITTLEAAMAGGSVNGIGVGGIDLLHSYMGKISMAGSIEGIVCVTSTRFSRRQDMVALWNPALNNFKPIPLTTIRGRELQSFGIAYDAVDADYAIIRIVPELDHADNPPDVIEIYSVDIYSLQVGNWVRYHHQSLPFRPIDPQCNFIHNGVPYWIGCPKTDGDVMKMYETELWSITHSGEIRKVDYPVAEGADKIYMRQVYPVLWKDSIAALVVTSSHGRRGVGAQFFTHDDYDGWNMLYDMGQMDVDDMSLKQTIPTGELILMTFDRAAGKTYYLYDFNVGRLVPFDEFDCEWKKSYHHKESLICFDDMVGIDEGQGLDVN